MSVEITAGRAAPERTSPFLPAVVVGAVLIGFLALIAYAGLGAFQQDFRSGDDGGAHALSKSAVGFAGLVTLLNAEGRPAVIARGDVGSDDRGPGMMVLTIDQGDPNTPLNGLSTTRAFAGPIFDILPKWETTPTLHRGWVRKVGLRDVDADGWIGLHEPRPSPDPDKTRPRIELDHAKGASRHTLSWAGAGASSIQVETGVIEDFQTFKSAPGWTPVIVDENGAMVLASALGGHVFALSEPDLLNNHGLADLANARAGLFVLGAAEPQGPVFFDVTLNGFERARSMMKLMLEPPFLGATLCALAAALMMIWHAIYRFGAPRRGVRELAMGKQVLADNQAGLIRMAGREHRMGGGYASLERGLAAKAVGAPQGLAAGALEAFLDRLGRGRTAETLSDLRAIAERAANNSELMDAAVRLHRWRLEMTREGK